jgi:hypothetical protein
MLINNKQKIEDNQKEINENNHINKQDKKIKLVFSKSKLLKPYQNFSLLPRIRQQDRKITIIKNDILKKPFIRSSSDIITNNYNYNNNINQINFLNQGNMRINNYNNNNIIGIIPE